MRHSSIFTTLLVLIIIPLTTQAQKADIKLIGPAVASIGEEIEIVVQLETGNLEVSGAVAGIIFDPNILEFVGFLNGDFDFELPDTINNTIGFLQVGAGTVTDFLAGSITLNTLRFKVLGYAENTNLSFITEGILETDIQGLAEVGVNIVGETIGLDLVVHTQCINSNGAGISSGGLFYGADRGFEGGQGTSTTEEILETTDDLIFQSARTGDFNYNISVPNGDYNVKLFFSEPLSLNAGDRVFSIEIEGQTVEPSFDILNNTSPNSAWIESYNTMVSDGLLNINFASGSGQPPLLSGLCIEQSSIILPVRLIDFSVAYTRDLEDVQIDWAVADELLFDSYIIERSVDNNDWAIIGNIESNDLNTAIKYYSFKDANLPNEFSSLYYRLKLLDLDGSFQFSEVKDIAKSRTLVNSEISVYPNPAHSYVSIILPNSNFKGQIELIDVNGKTWLRQEIFEKSKHEIAIDQLPFGMYILVTHNHTTGNINNKTILIE